LPLQKIAAICISPENARDSYSGGRFAAREIAASNPLKAAGSIREGGLKKPPPAGKDFPKTAEIPLQRELVESER
jgi:hypothetical protein